MNISNIFYLLRQKRVTTSIDKQIAPYFLTEEKKQNDENYGRYFETKLEKKVPFFIFFFF